MEENKITDGNKRIDDSGENHIRPSKLQDFIGQQKAKTNLDVFIKSAIDRKQALDHVLLYGPPGLGKTTLSQIISHELCVGFKATSGPVIAKAGDLAAILTNLEENDVLFIDEIHRLSPAVEEILYPAMEDFQLDLIIGEGPSARSVKIDLPNFTLVGATTRLGLLTTPLRDRFGIPIRMDFYNHEELSKIIIRASKIMNTNITEDGAFEIAKRSRGTPRVANRLLSRVRDFATVQGHHIIDKTIADESLLKLDVDNMGLDSMDRKYMNCIVENYGGGPVGVETISAVLADQRDMVEDVIEPYLMQQGLIQRTPRGRIISEKGYKYLGLKPKANIAQYEMLEEGKENDS